ncbi:hypothetical protein OUM_1672 [Helicobacter pylori R038b]|uniref:Lipoprotein n=1 Tax=Helicobacter pylori R038b TaxID=1145115 RepID=K2KJX5_HELPX|nr:hypothetical protein OUM_1672 [Helicobacter pylori R038b]
MIKICFKIRYNHPFNVFYLFSMACSSLWWCRRFSNAPPYF